jgi:hypothetical protein
MTDSHSTIMEYYNLHDNCRLSDTKVCKLEYTPKDDSQVYDIDSYRIRIDEDKIDIIDKYYEHENAILRKIHRITAKQIEVKNNNGIEPITSGNYGRIIGGDNSINIGGDNCSNIGGMFSTNIGGDFSYNTGGSFSKNTGRIRSKNTGLDYSTNIGGIESFNRGGRGSFNRGEANSKNIGGEQSTNIGGFNSINAGGLLSSLSFMYFQGNRRKIYTITVGENGVLPNVCYKFNETKLIHYEYDDAI